VGVLLLIVGTYGFARWVTTRRLARRLRDFCHFEAANLIDPRPERQR
jgi:hypothetical protein